MTMTKLIFPSHFILLCVDSFDKFKSSQDQDQEYEKYAKIFVQI